MATEKLAAASGGPLVGVIMGSDSDLPCMAAACEMLTKFGIAFEVDIVSAHRTPGDGPPPPHPAPPLPSPLLPPLPLAPAHVTSSPSDPPYGTLSLARAEKLVAYSRGAHERGIEVIIAGAGGAAHL